MVVARVRGPGPSGPAAAGLSGALPAGRPVQSPAAAGAAALAGRGRRSGIGLHGFAHGGLIVDGGRRSDDALPPLIARLDRPPQSLRFTSWI